MDEEGRTTYEPPAIEERRPVIGIMGNSFSSCVEIGVPENVCHEVYG